MDKFFKETLMIMVLSIVGLIIFSSLGLLWDEFGFWLIVFPFIGFLIYSLYENRTPKHIRKIKDRTDKSFAELNKNLAKEYREKQERLAELQRQREYEEEQNEKREKERLERLKYSQDYQQSIKEMNSTKNDCPNCGRSDGRHDPKCYV